MITSQPFSAAESPDPSRAPQHPPSTRYGLSILRLHPPSAAISRPRSPVLACNAQTCAVRTPQFDGPLELLLTIVRRQGVDVRQLRVAPITDSYLAQLDLLEALDLDVAGEFLVMAATLCLLKSRELVPRSITDEDQDDDEEEDLGDSLVRRLVEYERYRSASQELAERRWLGRDEFSRPATDLAMGDRPLNPGVDAMGLLEVLYDVLERKAAPAPVHRVDVEVYSLREMADWMLHRLALGPCSLSDLLSDLDRRLDRVVAFLATLEMARLQLIDVQQSHHLSMIVLHSRLPPGDADLTVLAGAS